jgi:hypothetical protein
MQAVTVLLSERPTRFTALALASGLAVGHAGAPRPAANDAGRPWTPTLLKTARR